MGKNKYSLQLKKELKVLIKEGNKLHKEQITAYGQLRGFNKPISVLLYNELDGGEYRELNAIETNTYKMPR